MEKVKIKLLRYVVVGGYHRAEEIITVDADKAKKLVDARMAVPLPSEEKHHITLFDGCG